MSKLLALLLAWLLLQLRKRGSMQKIRPKWLALTLIFPAASFGMLFVCFLGFRDQQDISMGMFLFCIGLSVANIAILYLVHRLELQAKEEQEIALLSQQLTAQKESTAALEQSYRAQRKASHDFNKHLQTIRQLVAARDIGPLEEYLDAVHKTQPTRILYVDSRHPIIDAVMNPKCQTAVDAGIDIQVRMNDLSGLAVQTDYLAVLLSNLLDNAIEACQRLEGRRFIHCKLVLESRCFYLSVSNSSPPVTVVNNTIETTKPAKRDHGYGLSIIRRVLKRLEAEYRFFYEDGVFTFAAEIPN